MESKIKPRGNKRQWYGESERQGKERETERGRRRGSKSDFAVQWCCWIIMKMKATESGSIGVQGNGAEADNTVKEKKKRTNKKTTVERRKRSVRQYEKKVQRKGEQVKRQYIYNKRGDYESNKK